MDRKKRSFSIKEAFENRLFINSFMVITAAIVQIVYSNRVIYINTEDYVQSGVAYALKYIPIILVSAFGGNVPGMMTVLIIFFYKTILYSSFSYLTFILLLVSCSVDAMTKKGFFKNKRMTVLAIVLLQLQTGVFWGIMLWLLSGNNIAGLNAGKMFYYFLNEFPGILLSCIVVYIFYKYAPDEKKLLLNNGKYYVDRSRLSDDDRYEVEGRSRIGLVVMQVIVFEAIILGLSAEIASNTLVPTMKYANLSTEYVNLPDEDWGDVKNAELLESKVSFRLEKEYELSLKTAEEYSVTTGLRNSQFSVKLAMLISIIVIPLAIFVNRYAQRRIADPIRNLSKAVSDIYNSDELKINEKVNEVHNLSINTKDEIEELYHAVDLTFYRLMEYIELVKSRQSIEDQLQIEKQANEAKSRFLSNISHEIRTPINAVLGFDEMIIRESDDEGIVRYARDIQSSSRTLLALINDILDFSKIEAGKMEIIPVEYELSSMINDLVNMAMVRAKEKNLEFKVNVNKEIPHILFGDEIRIKQCILNIITNGIKYTETGSVTLDIDYEKIEPDDDDYYGEILTDNDLESIMLKVKVTDTGIGIKDEDMEKLSTAFERIDEKRNRTIEGTGLGINIVNSLLDMMDSKLSVKSEYGKGSEFSFALVQKVASSEPIGDFATTYKESIKNTAEYKESFHAPDAKVLVVDDTKTNLTVIVGLLKLTQIEVDTVTSGMDAIEKVREKKYDLIFLDHRMPEMDGIQTFHAMQEMEDNINKDTPVIALTANAISGSREMYENEGFDNYMSKPVDPGRLEEMILLYLPKEKVSMPGDEGFVSTAHEESMLEKEAMQSLLKVTGVDIEYAIARCGSPMAAVDVMKDFLLSIEERSGLIEKYCREKDIPNYTIYVHGLKSSAKAIGAIDLSEKAEYLEKCGNDNWIEEIHDLTPELLELYRSYNTKLSVLSEEDDSDKEEIDPKELEGAYASIKEFVSGSFFDSADDIMSMLEDYRIPDEYKAKHKEIKRLMAAVDRDGLLKVL